MKRTCSNYYQILSPCRNQYALKNISFTNLETENYDQNLITMQIRDQDHQDAIPKFV